MSEERETTIELDELGETLNEIEKLSSEERIQLLNSFIGGFENWDQLNEDCRQHIVRFLDYKSICKLEQCSKKDQQTIKDAPIQIYSVAVVNIDDKIAYVSISFDVTSKCYDRTFYQDGKNVEERSESGVKIMTIKSTNCRQEAVKFAEKMIRKGRHDLEKLIIGLENYPFDNSQMKSLPRCKTARIAVSNNDQVWWWLQWLPEDNLDIWICLFEDIASSLVLTSKELNGPQFRNAEKFRLNGLVNYTKEQFLNLKLMIGVFNSISVTGEVINQFIKNWIDGTGFRFQQLHIGFWGYRKLDEILEGIDFREWDQDFVNEVSIKNVSFVTDFESVRGPGKLFQIPSKMDHFESITVQVSDVNTIFLNLYHTGTRATSSDGEIYANYTAPEQLESGF